MMLPGGPLVGYTNLELTIAAAVLLLPAVGLAWVANRGQPAVAG
jgi:hypothetical protein